MKTFHSGAYEFTHLELAELIEVLDELQLDYYVAGDNVVVHWDWTHREEWLSPEDFSDQGEAREYLLGRFFEGPWGPPVGEDPVPTSGDWDPWADEDLDFSEIGEAEE